MANNIKLLKMITSEEVLAEVTEETSSTISVKNPVRVVVVPSKADPKTKLKIQELLPGLARS